MSTDSFRYETSQTLHAALTDRELAALRGLRARAGAAIAAALGRLAAALGLRSTSRSS